MAWLQQLAGQAEHLLNKIDQNAATVLNDSNKVFNDDNGQEFGYDIDTSQQFKRSRSTSSLNQLISGTPVVEVLDYENETKKDTSTVFHHVSKEPQINVLPQKGLAHGNTEDHNVFEKALRSSPSSSSIHNSFIINQDLEALQAKVAQLELDNQGVNKQLLNMQHLYSELRNENANLQLQVQRTNEQLSIAQQEKEQYVARAHRILQEKEKLIALKETSSSSEAEQNILSNYNNELKKELEFQQTKVDELAEKNKILSDDLQSLQMQHQANQKKLNATIQNLEDSLANEKKIRSLAEEDCSQKNKELHAKLNQILQYEETIKSKNEEVGRLNQALRQRNDANFVEEYEDRIKSLTKTLMFKQNSLETITTEKNALKFHMEKIEAEHRRAISNLQKDQVKVINMQDMHEERITVPNFMRVSPHDKGVTRRVKQTYSTLDAISVRTGIFLRRYPVARVFVFTYMVVLHMWVLLVLFWYAPPNR